MRIKNLMNGTYLTRAVGDDGTGGVNNTDNNNDNNNDGKKDDKNNGQNNVGIPDDFWSNETQNNRSSQPENNNDNQPNSDQPNSTQQIDEYFNSIDFSEGIDTGEIAEQMQQGNMEGFNKAIQAAAKNAYKRSLIDSNKLMDAKISKAVEQAVQKSVGTVNQSNAVREMNQALPFTANKGLAPVATAVLQQLLGKGKNTTEAIEGVKGFFAETSKLSAKDLGMQVAPKNPGNRNYKTSNPPQNQDDDDGPIDWMNLLNN